MKIAWRIALVAVAAVLGWRALALGLGAHFAAQAATGDPAKLQAALAWDPSNLAARAQAATAAQSNGEEAAREAWSNLLLSNPASAEALLGLGPNIADDARQDALVEVATTLASSSPAHLKRAALHWVEREEPERAMAAWSDALLADPGERDALYPILMKLVEDERTRVLLADYAKGPPAWWDEFFRHVARTAIETDTVRGAYGLRRVPGAAPLTQIEREAYVERLRKDGLTTEAYLTWVNGLDQERRQFLGLLNNGSFEAEPTGIGWDWRVRSTKQLLAETAETYGTDGLRALHLVFRGFDDRLSHVSQELFLEPGRYRLSGKARPNGLKTSGGLQWVVDCATGDRPTRLAESERFLGSSQWESFELDFEIPGDCARPILRLTSAVRVSTDRRIDGSIWFDALRIQRLAALAEGGG